MSVLDTKEIARNILLWRNTLVLTPTPKIHKWLFTRDCPSFSPLHRRHYRQTDFWTSAWRSSCTVEDSIYWISTPASHPLPQPPLDSGSPRRRQSQPKDFWLLPWPGALASFTSLDVRSSGKTRQFLFKLPSRISLVHRWRGYEKCASLQILQCILFDLVPFPLLGLGEFFSPVHMSAPNKK